MKIPEYDYSKSKPEPSTRRDKIVRDAVNLIGARTIRINNKRCNHDCSGFVSAVYYKNGIDITKVSKRKKQNLVRTIHDHVSEKGVLYSTSEPSPGDLVFFSNTYKRYGTNYLSHIGIVEKLSNDGTIAFIHRGSEGITRDYMNLKKPHIYRDSRNKKILNSYVRRKRSSDPPHSKYLAGELFETYGDVIDP
jgi:hypothetical protein